MYRTIFAAGTLTLIALASLTGCATETEESVSEASESALAGADGNCTAHKVASGTTAEIYYASGTKDVYTPGQINHGVELPDAIFFEFANVTKLVASYTANPKTFSYKAVPEYIKAGLVPASVRHICKASWADCDKVGKGSGTVDGDTLVLNVTPKEIMDAVSAKLATFKSAHCTTGIVKIVVGDHTPPNQAGLHCDNGSLGATLKGANLPSYDSACNGTTPGE